MADFGEILRRVGEFGLFQQLLLIALCFPGIITGFVLASLVFIESDPERHCNTDWILGAAPNLTTEEQLNLTVPREEDGTLSKCQMFVPVDWDINAIREYGLNETTGCQNGWVYGNMMYEATIVTDYDLVCGRANMVQGVQSVLMAGVLIGSLMFGPLAESFGRKRANQIPLLIIFVFTVTTALSPNVFVHMVSLFFVGLGSGGFRVNCIILTTEWIGASKRSWGVCATHLFSAIGQCVVAGVIYVIRDWRVSQLISAAPLLVSVIYIWFIPESARWLLTRGRTEEAKQLIVKAAAINKRSVPDSLLNTIAVNNTVHEGGIKIILRSPLLTRYFCIQLLAWFAFDLSLNCLYLNMRNLGLSIFITQLLFGAVEIPATLLSMWLLELLGRKVFFIATFMVGGLSAIFILAVPEEYPVAVTSLAVTARFFLFGAVSVTVVYTQELFPTSVRQTATGLVAILGRIGALLAPLLNILAMYHWVIPITAFSSLMLVTGPLGFVLPETKRKELPETAEELENNRNVTSTTTASFPHAESTNMHQFI